MAFRECYWRAAPGLLRRRLDGIRRERRFSEVPKPSIVEVVFGFDFCSMLALEALPVNGHKLIQV